jgi:hypothetical protein
MSQTHSPLVEPSRRTSTVTVGRIAAALALAHVVLLFAAFSIEGVAAAEHGTAPAKLLDLYSGAPLTRTLLAGYAESLAFFVLVPAVVMIGWLFSRRTTSGRMAAQSFVAFGVAYVAGTLATGFPPGAAALYAAHHGGDPATLAIVNDIRNYSFFLQVALTAAMALALGLAARFEGIHLRWVGWGGIGFGVVGLLATPFAHNVLSMAFLVWWVGLAVVLLRDKSSQV